MTTVLRGLTAALVVLLIVPTVARAQQPSKSASLATELVRLLDQQKLDSIAAPQSDRYVGALYMAGTQLLVVSGKFASTDRIKYLLYMKNYKDAYIDLNSASEQQSKVFVSDLGANGLRFRKDKNMPSDTVDIAGKTVSFDGEWGRAKLTEAEYTKTYQTTDEQYSQMLQALIDALKKPS